MTLAPPSPDADSLDAPPISETAREAHPFAAALWMVGTLTGFSSMAIAARQVSDSYDTFEILAYRSLIGIVIVVIAGAFTGQFRYFKPSSMVLHFGRNVSHFAGQNLWLLALTYIPLAQLFALEFSYPILVALGASMFLGERLTGIRALTSLIGFCGILIVARPFGAGGLSIGVLAAIGCAFGFAGSALFTKRLTVRPRTTALSIMFWMVTIQSVLGLVCAFWDGDMQSLTWKSLPWISWIAASGIGAHYCLTRALSIAPASVVTPMDFLRLPLIAILGMLLYQEPLDIYVFIGAILIFGSNYLNILSESRYRK